jgi:hypothetical protein
MIYTKQYIIECCLFWNSLGSLDETVLAYLPLIHFDYGLHFLLPFQRQFQIIFDSADVLRSFLEINHQLLAVDDFCFLFGVLYFQP